MIKVTLWNLFKLIGPRLYHIMIYLLLPRLSLEVSSDFPKARGHLP